MENSKVFINTFIKRQKQTFFIRQEAKGSLKLFNYMFQVSTDNTVDFPPLNIYILSSRLELFIKSVFQSTSLLNHFCCKEGAGIELLQETSFHQGMIFWVWFFFFSFKNHLLVVQDILGESGLPRWPEECIETKQCVEVLEILKSIPICTL